MQMIEFIKNLLRKGISISFNWRFGGNNDRKESKRAKSDRPATVEIVAVRAKQIGKDS
jgi:hypothetical protein